LYTDIYTVINSGKYIQIISPYPSLLLYYIDLYMVACTLCMAHVIRVYATTTIFAPGNAEETSPGLNPPLFHFPAKGQADDMAKGQAKGLPYIMQKVRQMT
jgi:hypothetical protein